MDAINTEILASAKSARTAHTDPLVGDWVRFVDGSFRRIAYVWGDGDYQTELGWGHIFLCPSGNGDYSGSLYSAFQAQLTDTGETRPSAFWFFSHGLPRAGNGVEFQIPAKVWQAEVLPPKF